MGHLALRLAALMLLMGIYQIYTLCVLSVYLVCILCVPYVLISTQGTQKLHTRYTTGIYRVYTCKQDVPFQTH